MKVYIDTEFKCHTTNDGTMREVQTDTFASKCTAFIEGHRLKPDGETWVREDGEVFSGGEMITPWKPYSELDAAQREYERQLLADAENALAEQEVTIAELDALVLNLQYNNLINN